MAKARNKRYLLISLAGALLLALALYIRPLPSVKPTYSLPKLEAGQKISLPWPAAGQAAVGAVGYGLLDQNGQGQAKPMASTAKVMTALAVLDKYPLPPGQSGPMITITSDDIAFYQQARADGESVLPVAAGEQLSEYQALQALLIPSANNIAYTLARWSYGSLDNYLVYADQKAKDLGMENTNFADASGFSPQTTSTASDLIQLGLAALKYPLISSVVGQSQATLPIAGTVKNVNWLLGNEGIIGIKTGNTDQAGGCFLLAAKRTIDNQQVTILTSVMSAPDLLAAMTNAKTLLLAADKGFSPELITFTATYKAPWSQQAKATKNISLLAWQSSATKLSAVMKDISAGAPKGTLVGSTAVKNSGLSKNEPLHLDQELEKPSFWWRIFRL